MLQRVCTQECMFVRTYMCERACSVRGCLYSQCSRPGILLSDRIGADQCSLTEQLTWGKTLLSTRRLLSFYRLLSSPSFFLALSFLTLTQTEIPGSHNAPLSLPPLSFLVFRSLTQSVSFYITPSVKIPCGRAACKTHTHTTWQYTIYAYTVSDMHMCAHAHASSSILTCNVKFHSTFTPKWVTENKKIKKWSTRFFFLTLTYTQT